VPSSQEWESLKKQQWEENSTGEGGRPTSHMSCKQTCQLEKAGAAAHTQQSGAEKLVKVAVEENSTGEGGRRTFHVNCK
jgi:hypothetical protein